MPNDSFRLTRFPLQKFNFHPVLCILPLLFPSNPKIKQHKNSLTNNSKLKIISYIKYFTIIRNFHTQRPNRISITAYNSRNIFSTHGKPPRDNKNPFFYSSIIRATHTLRAIPAPKDERRKGKKRKRDGSAGVLYL